VWCLVVIGIFGGVGGIVNAYFTDNGFAMPKWDHGIWRPGFLGNVLVGFVAAVVSWGLYGPFANVVVMPVGTASSNAASAELTVSSLVGAILVGIGGAKWLTNEVDKKALHATAAAVALKVDPDASAKIASSSPFEGLRIARALSTK